MFTPFFCSRQEWHAVCQRVRKVHQVLLWGMLLVAFFLVFLVSPWCFVHVESPSFAGLLVVYKTWVTQVCLLLGHALWAEVGGGITFVTSGENT